MLDSIFRTNGERRQVEVELRDLLAEVREERDAVREERESAREEREALRAEREAFNAQMNKAGGALAKLVRTNKALDDVSARAESVMRKVEGLAGKASGYEDRIARVEKLDDRIADLLAQIGEAEQTAKSLLEPGGHIHAHRDAIDDLGAEARHTRAALAAIRQEREGLEKVQAQLRKGGESLQQSLQGVQALHGELAELRKMEGELRGDVRAVRDLARDARADSERAVGAAKEIETRFESLAQLQELSKDTEKRIGGLHALAEHVSLKAKALETQRHAVDHAVAETARLNQMVWAMDAQVGKLAEGREQMQRTEEAVTRIEALARTATQDLATATAAREEFVRESSRLEGQGRSLLEALRAAADRLTVSREEFGVFDERLKSLSTALGDTEVRMQAVLAKDEVLAAMQQKTESLDKVFGDLRTETEDLARKQSALDDLTEQLGLVESLGRRTAAQHDSLMKAQGELEAMRTNLDELQKAYGEVIRQRDRLAQDRDAFEEFTARASQMIGRTPEIEARLEAVLGKMSLLEDGNQRAQRLAESVAGLDTEVTRVGSRMQVVEKVELRVNELFALTTEVERRMAEQVSRRSEVDALAHQCDSLGTRIGFAQQQLEGVAAQQVRLAPLTEDVARLADELRGSQRALEAMRKAEAEAHEQQTRLAGLIEHGLRQAAETSDRLRQVQAMSQDLAQVSTRSEEVMGQLTQVQTRQRDVLSQVTLTEAQMQRAEAMSRQLDHRRSLLVHTEKSLASFESRLAELDRHANGLELKMKSLADREALVQAVKAEVEGIRQISSKSKADLQFVADHRKDVSDLRSGVEDLLARIGDTDEKIVLIESWRRNVEETRVSAQAVTAMLGEMQGTLESLSEQRVVIDDVGEKLARLDFTVQEAQGTLSRLDTSAQEAQNTLRTLQREREVAERVEKSIKAVRAGGGRVA